MLCAAPNEARAVVADLLVGRRRVLAQPAVAQPVLDASAATVENAAKAAKAVAVADRTAAPARMES